MAFQIDPGRTPGELRPLENQVPVQEIDDPRAMLPLVPAREQQNHDVRQHASLGHAQHDEMEIQDMLPLQYVIDLEQNDGMLEDDNAQPRGQVVSPRTAMAHALQTVDAKLPTMQGSNKLSKKLARNERQN